MRLYRRGVERLVNRGGLAQCAGDIAEICDARIGNVRAAAENLGRSGSHRPVHLDHERQWRVFDLDMAERLRRYLGADGGNRRYFLAGEANLAIFHPQRGEHSALLPRRGQIDAAHCRVRVGAPQYRSVKHPGHLDVVAVTRAPGRLERTVDSRRFLAQYAEPLAPLPR